MKEFHTTVDNVYSGSVADGLEQKIDDLHPTSIFIIADDNTAKFCVPLLTDVRISANNIIISAGEEYKNMNSCDKIWTTLMEHGTDRNTLIINVGGGVICDIGGFAASCYQRGIRFINIPTTVIAMADAAIGGKTGIDYKGLKNYIGLFSPPVFTWIDVNFLKTLPKIEIVSGLSEIIKHAVIGSNELWDMLEQLDSANDIRWDKTIETALRVKLKIVEVDPLEAGRRKILNFGHTIGHALESYFLSTSKSLSHGKCVALGMLVEAKISNKLGLLNNEDFNAIVRLIVVLLEPVMESLPTFEQLNSWMIMDKKKTNAKIGFSLPDRIGSCNWDIVVDQAIIAESFSWLAQAQLTGKRFNPEV